jgi:hypothetical protein
VKVTKTACVKNRCRPETSEQNRTWLFKWDKVTTINVTMHTLVPGETNVDRSKIEDALKSMRWDHNTKTDTWSNKATTNVDFETAVVYAIRFGSVPPQNVGDPVKVAAGPFLDFNGTVESIDLDINKVTVMIFVHDRLIPVHLQVQELILLR